MYNDIPIVLHCLIQKHKGYYSAKCLDFSLYAIAASEKEVKLKLHTEIITYIDDTFLLKEKQVIVTYLLRVAETSEWYKFYLLLFCSKFKIIRYLLKYINNQAFTIEIQSILTPKDNFMETKKENLQIALTPSYIKQFDELYADRKGNELTLKTALQFHSNMENILSKREKELWKELINLYNLDVKNNTYIIDTKEGKVCIVESEQ